MPRLIDDMRAANLRLVMPHWVTPRHYLNWEAHATRIVPILADEQLPIIHIDNVAEYYFTASDQEFWDLTSDFPNLAPPFVTAWWEHRLPRVIHSKEKGDTRMDELVPKGRVGMLTYAATRKDVLGEGIPENLHWLICMEIFIDYGNGDGAVGPHGTMYLGVDAEGKLVDVPWMASFASEEDNRIIHSLMTWAHPVLLAISFMHCKNVKIVDDPMPKPLAKKFHRRTGQWPSRPKILEIQPLKEILRREGRSDTVGVKKAMHICRGHFKDYREGKGLFGRYHQLVWQPQLVRGGKKGDKAPAREMDIKV